MNDRLSDDAPPDVEVAPGARTIRDVARLAGVSIGTVSKALNANGRLSAETRAKVLRIAKAIDYRPNDLAQSLHRARSMTVGILSNDSFGRFAFPIVAALERRLFDHGIAVFMCNATDDPVRERRHIDQLLGKRVDGLVVTARRADRRAPIEPVARGLPVVYVYSQVENPEALCLLPDDEGGARLAVGHLAALGRKKIAHITGPERFEAVRLREMGWRKALAEAGLQAASAGCRPGRWTEAWGHEAAQALFSRRPGAPDALFCGNDQIARGAVEALLEMGLGVPDDVAVVGFDNWDVMTEAARPSLTSVDMNLDALGREAGASLLEMMAGRRLTGVRRLPCSLVIRNSCGARARSEKVETGFSPKAREIKGTRSVERGERS
jgi:LacI family transcriptional regulator